MSNGNQYYCKITHYLPGRIRIKVPGLKRNSRLLELITEDLCRLATVKKIQGSTASGRILVHFSSCQNTSSFAPLLQTASDILLELEALLNAPEAAATSTATVTHVPARGHTGDKLLRITEPEDLPLGRQAFNVALGGTVLAAVGVKHLWRGPSRWARSPFLFNLAALTALISGYPVLKSGVHHLSSRGKINFDLLLSIIGLGTMLLRESIPGLLVFWLVNLNAFLQSLVLSHSLALVRRECTPWLTDSQRKTLAARLSGRVKPASTGTGDPAGQPANEAVPVVAARNTVDAAVRYGDRMLPVALGFSALSGLVSRDPQRSLAMMLAASPGPAGIAGRSARAVGTVAASRMGIRIIDPRILPVLPAVDVLVFSESWQLYKKMSVEYFYALPGFGRQTVQQTATDLLNAAGCPVFASEDGVVRQLRTAAVVEIHEISADGINGTVDDRSISIGKEEYIRAKGVDPTWGLLKARRIASLGAVPVFVALDGRLAAVMGIVCSIEPEMARVLEDLRSRGIRRLAVCTGTYGHLYTALAREAGLECWSGLSMVQGGEKILSLRQQGQIVAVVSNSEADIPLLTAADIAIAGLTSPVVVQETASVVIPKEALADLFGLGLAVAERERQNIHLTAALNAFGLLLGSTGRLLPVAATIYNNMISVAVTLNAYRLLAFPPVKKRVVPASSGKIKPALVQKSSKIKNTPVPVPAGAPIKANGHPLNGDWPRLDVPEVLRLLQTDVATGLSSEQVAMRLSHYGPNRLEAAPPPGLLARFASQMKDFLVQALLASSVICLFAGEFVDALAIMSIIAINAVLGAVQEHKAEKSMEALKELTIPTSRVLRDGRWQQIPSPELVPGDVIMLEAGDGVPADARLLEVNELQVMEAALTGESYPVDKDIIAPMDCVSLLDCKNMVFMGTTVGRGRCRAVITATGMKTELGNIADMLAHYEYEKTPLQKNLSDVGKIVLKASLAVSGVVIAAGIWRGGAVLQMFLTGISLAVAAIPEGLPAIVTVALAIGVRRMSRVHAVVRRLPAVENLGSATVICTDKTGTLTRNEQTVRQVYCADGGCWRRNSGNDKQAVEEGFTPVMPGEKENLVFLLTAACLCSNARLLKSTAGRPERRVDGDPTEGALLAAAEQAGLDVDGLRDSFTRVREIPFDSERYRMTVVCRNLEGGYVSFVKGAPDVILQLCSRFQGPDGPVPMDEMSRRRFLKIIEQMAAGALRVLAVAYRPLPAESAPAEKDLIFLGLTGMLDPPRPEVRPAIAACRRAGIKVVMITGDHHNTALAIGRELGLVESGEQVLTGAELEKMDDDQLQEAVERVNVYARVLPRHKLRLVKAFKRRGELVAMIGDGVNDAPAVKEADIGVAMGQSGTEVTKQSSQLILTDDNFITIVSAVEQGRGICANVRRAVRYLLATNVGEVLLMFFTVAGGLPLPLLPIQLLWLNLLGDGLPAVALSLDPPDPAVMNKPPRNFKAGLFDRDYVIRIVSRGLAIGLATLGAYWWGLRPGNLVRARTLALATITVSQLVHALDCRHDGADQTHQPNRFLGGSVALSGALLLSAIYLPPGQRIFKTLPLTVFDWGAVLAGTALANGMDYLFRPVFNGLLPKVKLHGEEVDPALPTN